MGHMAMNNLKPWQCRDVHSQPGLCIFNNNNSLYILHQYNRLSTILYLMTIVI